ncbi:acylamino acid-releasing enzyme [Fusobacterium vincentii ATCC 51190]|nr:acylamino acid-releasing enzyme [Fusobacterium vincentii ATCC 51190]
MENLKLDSFLEYKFLSNLDFNPDGSNLAFSLSEADLENNSYKHFIYNLDTKNKEIKKLTHSGKEKNSLWLNNNTILFSADRDKDIEEKKKLGETWTIFYALDIKNGGEAYEYMKLPVNVTEIKIIDENNFILTADFDNNSLNLNDLKGGEREKAIKQIEENKDYEVLDEIPFWSNGNGFRNKKRNRLYHFDKSNNKLTPISDEYTNVESFNIKENKVIFVGRTYKDKQALTAGLYTYDVKSNKLEIIISDNLYDISRQPVLKKCRNLGIDPVILGVKKSSNRQIRPNANKKPTEYATQLREKQKAKFIYNVMEKQFRKIYEEAARKLGVTGLTLIEYLERRLENVVYRLGFAKTRRQARQIVSHGHIAVNGRRVNIASFRVKVGDIVSVIENSKNVELIKLAVEDATPPAWLELDRAAFSGKVLQNPTKDDLDFDLNESLIVEFYSR